LGAAEVVGTTEGLGEGAALTEEAGTAGANLPGGGPWVEKGINLSKGGAVLQTGERSCVSACGEMLSEGAMTEKQFIQRLGAPGTAGRLVNELNKLEGAGTWTGSFLYTPEAAVRLSQSMDSTFGAVLQAPYLESHMVVMEAIGEDGLFLVRDPGIGGTYQVGIDWVAEYVIGLVW
jgi:hypothetical protein